MPASEAATISCGVSAIISGDERQRFPDRDWCRTLSLNGGNTYTGLTTVSSGSDPDTGVFGPGGAFFNAIPVGMNPAWFFLVNTRDLGISRSEFGSPSREYQRKASH